MVNDAIKNMLNAYDLSTVASAADAVREVIQEIALLGLSRSSFFTKAAFYGGTALRIFYGLDRYSEDMDFSLLRPDESFDLSEYETFVVGELAAFGFEVSFEKRGKTLETQIESAFIKADTRKQFLVIENTRALAGRLPKGQAIRVKIEVDTDPPLDFKTETKYHLRPIPFSANVYSMPDLFAGKMHALLCRDWEGRVKGRDWYDFVWYVSRYTPLHLAHLDARMIQSGHRKHEGKLTSELFRELIRNRIEALDVAAAKNDVKRFLPLHADISIWDKVFFLAVAEKIRFV
jgi:predicted nucleotidyltransferase component of viral defense system